jgi:predicted DNA-binding protein YlxM (UPF0122 family)
MFNYCQTYNFNNVERCDITDLLRHRIKLLSGEDKLLMIMYLEKGNSFRQMAKLAGVHETIIARRIHKITKRLIYGEYITCLRNSKKFSTIELAIAKEYFLIGLSMREIARERQITYYQVRKILKKIRQINSINQQLVLRSNSQNSI